MIKNDFGYYLEKQELIKTLEVFKEHFENLEQQNYNEALSDIFGKLFSNAKVVGHIERYKDAVFKNFTNIILRKVTSAENYIASLQGDHERWIQNFEEKVTNLSPEAKQAIIEKVTKILETFIERVILKKPKTAETTLSGFDEEDIVKYEKEAEKLPEPDAQALAKGEEVVNNIRQQLKEVNDSPVTGDLPQNVDELIQRYLRGQSVGTPKQLIRELAAMSKDPNIRKNPQTIRGVINILSGLILMTRKSATKRETLSKLIRDTRTKLLSINATAASTPTQTQK